MDIKSSSVNYRLRLSVNDMSEAVRLLLNTKYGQNLPENSKMNFQQILEGQHDTLVGYTVTVTAEVHESKLRSCLG